MKLKSFVLNLLFPIYCLGCGREGSWLCEKCFGTLKSPDKRLSYRQKHHLVIPDLTDVFIAGDYDGDPLLALTIKQYKYDFMIDLGKILARFLGDSWEKSAVQITLSPKPLSINPLTTDPLIMPIPLSRRRYLWRGFNQAEILAREFSARFNYGFHLKLKRIRHCQPQAELNGAKRLDNIRGIFSWTGADLNGQTLILIDDVVTTGSTLNEAARVLKLAGAGRIYGLVLAKG